MILKAMGIVHTSYYISLPSALASIQRCSLSLSPVQDYASQAILNPTDAQKSFLEDIRFDKNWLTEGTSEFELLKLAVSRHILGWHNLSNRSFAVLEIVLPSLAWAEPDITLLLMGRCLKSPQI